MREQFILRKEFRFEAAHQLIHHDGKCARLHGHSWLLTVEVAGDQLQGGQRPNPDQSEATGSRPVMIPNPKSNMLIDYSDIKSTVGPYIEIYLDHHHLNETMGTDSPTSEYLARRIFSDLKSLLKGLRAIEIDETCTSSCRYEIGDAVDQVFRAIRADHPIMDRFRSELRDGGIDLR